MDILDQLSRSETGLTLAEIARVLGRSVSEIFRLLVVLQERGDIAFATVTDRYVLSMFEIAHRTPLICRRPATSCRCGWAQGWMCGGRRRAG